MNKSGWSKRSLKFLGVLLAVALATYLLWDGSNGWGGSELFTGIALLLVLGAMFYIKVMENKADKNVAERIREEYPPESQEQVLEIYQHLKTRELEGLFLKILDDANGDSIKVKKLATLAESVGWKAFLENHW